MEQSGGGAKRAVHASRIASASLLAGWLVACAGLPYDPPSLDSVPFRARAQTQEQGQVRVSTAVPSAEETRKIFGLPLYARDVQPVWLEVENRGESMLRFAPVSLDREYFSPLEVSYVHRAGYSKKARATMDERFHDLAMSRFIPPGETRSGFVFTHKRPGTKVFNVDLFGGAHEDYTFIFFVQVPGFVPDHAEVDFDALYGEEKVRDYSEAEARSALEALACCTTDASGTEVGDPVSVVLVGDGEDVLQALLRAEWFETARPKTEISLRKPHHYLGRPADATFKKRRSALGQRNELRLWLAPFTIDGQDVWLARASHHVGAIELFSRLDPDVDDVRNYLMQNLWYSQGLVKVAWQAVEEPVRIDEPRRDFNGARYFTDGYRIVLWVSGPPFSMLETSALDWDEVPRR